MKINTVAPPDIITAGQHFSRVPTANINRSTFDRSHDHKTTFDAGYLIPVFRDIVWPGDTINLSIECLARLATLIKPLMDRAFLDLHVWAVPLRLLQPHFVNLMGERDPNPDSSIDYVTPKLEMRNYTVTLGSIHHYLGIPLVTFEDVAGSDTRYHSYYHRAYFKIFDDQYRDQNLQDSLSTNLGTDGPDNPDDYFLARRGKRHDYFTSALGSPQKGNAVTFSLAGFAPIEVSSNVPWTVTAPNVYYDNTNLATVPTTIDAPGGGAPGTNAVTGYTSVADLESRLTADLTGISAVALNDFRIGAATQQVLERDMRSGTRYPESMRAHFGVNNPDSRMQRAELLGSYSIPLSVSQVPQTAISGATPQGNLAAWGAIAGQSHNVVQSFTEHCVVMVIASARAPYTYSQGIRRDYRYSSRFDFMLPEFANLGEQAIRQEEIYASNSNANNDITFGYQERWAEMRYMPSQCSGLFDPNAAGTLSVWHLGEDFTGAPTLNEDFIEENPPFDRVIATPAEPHFLAQFWFNYRHTRPLPVFSVPGLDKI